MAKTDYGVQSLDTSSKNRKAGGYRGTVRRTVTKSSTTSNARGRYRRKDNSISSLKKAK
jgi:hypothetical protein